MIRYVVILAAVLTFGGFLPRVAEGSSLSGLCNVVTNDTGGNIPYKSIVIQFNGTTWVLTNQTDWNWLAPQQTGWSCAWNFSTVTFKQTYWWNFSSQSPVLWTWAASTLTNAAGPN